MYCMGVRFANIPGSDFAVEFCGGLSSASGNEPSDRIPCGVWQKRLRSNYGWRLRSSLCDTGLPISGKRIVETGIFDADQCGFLRLE